MATDRITVLGAREHNLKNIEVSLPRDQFVVITGLSGSGKSSLAFDTLYAEGQRRYVESLSAYARQFLGLLEKPDVDQIEGLSPAISIDQKSTNRNPRSTVGTVTEVFDYLRLLYARIGQPHCTECGAAISQQTPQQIVDQLRSRPVGSRLMLLAPRIRNRKGRHTGELQQLMQQGYVRVRVNGEIYDVAEVPELDRYKNHTIEAVVDRLVISADEEDENRLADSVETCLDLGDGVMILSDVTDRDRPREESFSRNFACADCGVSLEEIEPRSFSFNSPHGACERCDGIGMQNEFDLRLIVDQDLSLSNGCIRPWQRQNESSAQAENWERGVLAAFCRKYGIPTDIPYRALSQRQQDLVVMGPEKPERNLAVSYRTKEGKEWQYEATYRGVVPSLRKHYRDTGSDSVRERLEGWMSFRPCPDCRGMRLKAASLAVTIGNLNIMEVSRLTVANALRWVEGLQADDANDTTRANGRGPRSNGRLSARDLAIGGQVLKEIQARLSFMVNVGLEYLSLERRAATLSGGEAQRIRLATQIGSQLMGVLYILDEPSIGLHQRDNERLLNTLCGMRDLGNTVVVVEHDEDTIRTADWVVDMGPGAGEHGGEVVCSAPQDEFMAHASSLTAQYLRREKQINMPTSRRKGNGTYLRVVGAAENNLNNVTVRFPLGTFTVVTGVSGSGKSTLVNDVLYRFLAQTMYQAKTAPGKHEDVEGWQYLDKVIDIDQSPIGRTPRSNPATYVDLFGPMRDLFASLPEAKARGYKPGRFSFNVAGGRCEACKGAGIEEIEMQFLPNVYVQCDECQGRRYNRETLEIRFRGHSVSDVLNMTIEEAAGLFANIPRIKARLDTLLSVGLGYIRLGQPATTLSGGEAQRVKLSKELSRRDTGNTLYILDEPTTGLHFEDVNRLLQVLHSLVDKGNTVLVIEHNLDVIKNCDWIVDMGPEGGDNGGEVITEGTPEQVVKAVRSYTGRFLQPLLNGSRVKVAQPA